MKYQTRQAALIAVIMVLGIAFLVGDLHKVILQAVWPYFELFYDRYFGYYTD
jgi:hypothetical protein